MGQKTNIEWTQATWNPWHGCRKISPGCKKCYMFREKRRYGQDPTAVVRSRTTFKEPLSWPHQYTLCFTCSWSDWLIEEADAWREEAYDIMRRTPWIMYQILTKRIDRAAGRVPDPPLPNAWFGVSAEDQLRADKRIPLLAEIPAALRFVSYEPALTAVNFSLFLGRQFVHNEPDTYRRGLDWVIAGGESGSGARPTDPQWFRDVRDQCVAAGVPFFFKQWGEWLPAGQEGARNDRGEKVLNSSDEALRIGKKSAGRFLDGQEWSQIPQVAASEVYV